MKNIYLASLCLLITACVPDSIALNEERTTQKIQFTGKGGANETAKNDGISFGVINDRRVVIVDRLEKTEVVRASLKEGIARSFRIIRRPDIRSRFGFKAQLTDSEDSGDIFASTQNEDSIFLIRPVGQSPVLICGTIQNPCAIEDDSGMQRTHDTCGAGFSRPDDQPLDDYYEQNEEDLIRFCEGEGGQA